MGILPKPCLALITNSAKYGEIDLDLIDSAVTGGVDIIQLRDKSKKLDIVLDSIKMIKGDLNVSWLSLDKTKMVGTFVNYPERQEVDMTINEQLVVEYYSR